jgi:hypothetical protein
MILGYAVAREVHICRRQCVCDHAEHIRRLRNPNLNLHLVCQQVNEEMKALSLSYRIIVRRMICLRKIRDALPSQLLQQTQFVLRDYLLAYVSATHLQQDLACMRSFAGFWVNHGFCKTAHLEISEGLYQGKPRRDVVFTF